MPLKNHARITKDLYKTRRERFTELVQSMTNGAIASALGVKSSYVSQLKNGNRNITGDSARVIEENLGAPRGYLDGVGV